MPHEPFFFPFLAIICVFLYINSPFISFITHNNFKPFHPSTYLVLMQIYHLYIYQTPLISTKQKKKKMKNLCLIVINISILMNTDKKIKFKWRRIYKFIFNCIKTKQKKDIKKQKFD